MRLLLKSARAGEDPRACSAARGRGPVPGRSTSGGPRGGARRDVRSAVAAAEVLRALVGDSRAYWLAADPAEDRVRLTRDDSLAEEIVAVVVASVDEAMASPQVHVITRWLGADLPEPQPHVAQFAPPGPGVLLICSDGRGMTRRRPRTSRPSRCPRC